MEELWKFSGSNFNCFVNQFGDVKQYEQIVEPRMLEGTRHRVVDLEIERHEYDYENQRWLKLPETVLVWQLMRHSWFSNWPSDSVLHFVDGDPWNCSVDNIRAWSTTRNRMIRVREEGWGYVFDKRLQGTVEIVELDQRVSGVAEAARLVGGTKSGVSFVLSGRLDTHRGFHFRWV